MPQMTVIITDQATAKSLTANLPDDAPLGHLLPALVTKMGLATEQFGEPTKYLLIHKTTGKQLRDDDTLSIASVAPSDTLILMQDLRSSVE